MSSVTPPEVVRQVAHDELQRRSLVKSTAHTSTNGATMSVTISTLARMSSSGGAGWR